MFQPLEAHKVTCTCGNDNLRFENVLLNWDEGEAARLEVHDRCFRCFTLHVSIFSIQAELVEHREEKNLEAVTMG